MRGSRLGLLLAAAIPACHRQPSAFYYYDEQKIALEVDSTQLVAAGPDALAVVAGVLGGAKIPIDSIVPVASAPSNVIVYLRRGFAAITRDALRRERRVVFVSYAYRVRDGGSFIPVNRIAVHLRAGATASVINDIAARYGLTIERDGPRVDALTYSLAFTHADPNRDALKVAAEIHRHPAVKGAEIDHLSDIRRSN